MLEAITQVRRAAAECAEAPVWSLSDAELADCLEQAWAGIQALTALVALVAHLIHQAQSRGMPATEAASSVVVWLRQRLRMNPGTAARLVRLAGLLDAQPVLDSAVSAGAVSAEQAESIAQSVADLPAEAGLEAKEKAEGMLIDWAGQFDARTLGKLGSRILTHVAPDLADQRDGEAVRRQEARAHRNRAFTLSPMGDGSVRVSGWLDAAGAATVNAALDPLCHPRHDIGGTRTPAQRRADALVDVCALALRTTELPTHGGDPAQVVVTMAATDLAGENPDGGRDEGRPGWLDTGLAVSAAEARRMACDAQILPAVLGGDGQVLDLGRARRLISGPLRRALILRDGGCAFPACDRPARWCQGHHIIPWADGGATDLQNACLLCTYHHRLLHHSDWQVRLAPDGHPEFIPPATVDPQRRPRRNMFHRRQ